MANAPMTQTIPTFSRNTAAPQPHQARPGTARIAPSLRRPLPLRPVRTARAPDPVAFASAAEAWFWTLGALEARRDGSSGGGRGIPRPCDPDDVIRAIDLLHRRGGIDLSHARVMRRWGERRIAPGLQNPDAQLWNEAMERLDGLLRAKQIVG